MTDETARKLIRKAEAARGNAYAPFSRFQVGAALQTDDGRIFEGCNVENQSFGATMCAERVAVFGAVAAGSKRIKAIAITGDYPRPLAPCGMCRQVLAEFGAPDTRVIMANTRGEVEERPLGELLPLAFRLEGTPQK